MYAAFSFLQLLFGIALICVVVYFLRNSFMLWIGLVFSFVIILNVILNMTFLLVTSSHCGRITLVIANSLQFYLVLICTIFVVTSFIDKGIVYVVAGTTRGFDEFCDDKNKAIDCVEDKKTLDGLNKVANSTKRRYIFIPFLAIGLLVLIAFLFISSFCFNGREFFATFSLYIVNINNLVVGTALVILGALLLSYGSVRTFDGWKVYRAVFIVAAAMGGFMIFAGFFGCSAACVDKSQGCFWVFIGIGLTLTLAFAAMVILAAVSTNHVIDALLELGEVEGIMLHPFAVANNFPNDVDRASYVHGLLSGILHIVFAVGIMFLVFTMFSVFGACVKGCPFFGMMLDDIARGGGRRRRYRRLSIFANEEDGDGEEGERAESLEKGLIDQSSSAVSLAFGTSQFDMSSNGAGGKKRGHYVKDINDVYY